MNLWFQKQGLCLGWGTLFFRVWIYFWLFVLTFVRYSLYTFLARVCSKSKLNPKSNSEKYLFFYLNIPGTKIGPKLQKYIKKIWLGHQQILSLKSLRSSVFSKVEIAKKLRIINYDIFEKIYWVFIYKLISNINCTT